MSIGTYKFIFLYRWTITLHLFSNSNLMISSFQKSSEFIMWHGCFSWVSRQAENHILYSTLELHPTGFYNVDLLITNPPNSRIVKKWKFGMDVSLGLNVYILRFIFGFQKYLWFKFTSLFIESKDKTPGPFKHGLRKCLSITECKCPYIFCQTKNIRD